MNRVIEDDDMSQPGTISVDSTDHSKNEDSPNILVKSGFSTVRIRLIRTCSMTLLYVCGGLYCGILTPATLDLMDIFGCNVEQFGLILTAKQIGIIFGSFSGAAISDRYRRKADIMMAVVIIMYSACNAAVPWCANPWLAAVVLTLTGILHGTMNVVCSSVTMAEWGERSPAPVNLLHFAFTFGTLLAPPTTAPFLSDKTRNDTNYGSFYNMHPYTGVQDMWTPNIKKEISVLANINSNRFLNVEEFGNVTEELHLPDVGNSTMQNSRIFIPFSFHSALGICVGLLFIGYYMAGWTYQTADRNTRRGRTTQATGNNKMLFKICMAASMLWIYICIVARDSSIGAFIFYVAVTSSLQMTKLRAAMLNTAYAGSRGLGRLLGTIFALFLRIHYVVFFCIICGAVIISCLVFFGLKTEAAFWGMTCAIGVLGGPVYASVMAWADRYIEMDGLMVGLVDMGIGAGSFLALYFGGYLLHHYGPMYVFLQSAVAAVSLLLTVVILQIVCTIRGDRFRADEASMVHQHEDLIPDDLNETEPLINS